MTEFAPAIRIGPRDVGAGRSAFIIAEAGVNHFGSLDKARALVDMAADAGADAFKTQAFRTDRLVSAELPEWRERLRPKEVSFEFLAQLKEHCDRRRILFLCTPHDESVLPWLDALDVPAFKIGSGERSNLPFFREIARRGKPVILSTGMYELDHVRQALQAFSESGCRELALLHCVTSYPTPYDQVNLRAMDTLRAVFPGPVGYSYHTYGHHVCLAAVARGATIIEKHITLDFDVPNAQDWKVSAGPDDFAALVRSVREVEAALGSAEKRTAHVESAALGWALKSLVAARRLPRGSTLTSEMLLAKRPGGGIEPSRLPDVLGRTLRRDLEADEALAWSDLE